MFLLNFLLFLYSMLFQFFQLYYEKFQIHRKSEGMVQLTSKFSQILKLFFHIAFSLFLYILFSIILFESKFQSNWDRSEKSDQSWGLAVNWTGIGEPSKALGMFYILTCMVVTYVKSHWAIHLRSVHFTVSYISKKWGEKLQSMTLHPKYLSIYFLGIRTFSYIITLPLSHLRKLTIIP